MNRWVKHLLMVALCGLVSLVGCGGSDDNIVTSTVTISITSPGDQSYVLGQVEVTFEVTGEVERVELLVDDAVVGESNTAPFSITWSSDDADEALHRLRAVAYGPGTSQSTSSELLVVVDRTAPTGEFSNLSLPYIMSGDMTIAVGAADENEVAEVSLLIDGALHDTCTVPPCFFDWDTTVLPDGAAELTAEITDLAGNTVTLTRPVAVVNTGTIVAFNDGSGSGLYDIPENWAELDLHKKFHFTMPAGTTEIMAIGQWFDMDWEMEIDIGTGFCPHSGQSLAEQIDDGGQILFNHTAADLGLTEYVVEDWFIHAGTAPAFDMNGHIGEGTYYALTMVLY